jgi:hypothetical protein
MKYLITLLALFLLAGSPNDRRSPPAAPDSTRGVYVDRHIDAHVPGREGDPAASVPDDRSERRSAPDPAQGSSVLQPPSPPAIQNYRDPLYRDRRY